MSLIWKHGDIVPNRQNPFALDVLGRKQYADNLTRLIESTREPLVLSVNAAWGAGKTTFLRMWREQLEGDAYHTLFFDAWKHDFVDDPLVALIAELQQEIDGSEALGPARATAQPLMRRLRTVGAGMLRRSVPVLIRAGTAGLVDATDFTAVVDELGKGVSEEAAKVAEERLARYAAEKSAMEKFREGLQELATALAGDNGRKSVVVFIDELDRCRPDFAIVVLERVKHLFAVPGFVFVLGMDATQLAASVKAVYGADFAAEGYLRRFIDLDFNLPAPAGKLAVEYLAKQVNLTEALSGRADWREDEPAIIELLSAIMDRGGMTFRLQQQCFSRLNLVLRTIPKTGNSYPYLIAVMITLKALNPSLAAAYQNGSAGAEHVLTYFQRLGSGPAIPRDSLPYAEACLYGFSQVEGEYSTREATLRAEAGVNRQREDSDWHSTRDSQHRLDLLRSVGSQNKHSVRIFFQRLELADAFSDTQK